MISAAPKQKQQCDQTINNPKPHNHEDKNTLQSYKFLMSSLPIGISKKSSLNVKNGRIPV